MHRIFGKPLSPDELVKKWRQSIRSQERELDKQIRGIEAEEIKVKKSIKEAAKRGDKTCCTMLAKQIVRSRKAKDRIHTSKAQLNSILMQLQQQLAQVKIAGTLKKSTEIMKLVNRLVKLPEIGKAMQDMSAEMMKAGIIEEMMEDTLNMDTEDIEEEAEEEVSKVLTELTAGLFTDVGPVGSGLPIAPEEEKVPSAEDLAEDMVDMKERLEALKS